MHVANSWQAAAAKYFVAWYRTPSTTYPEAAYLDSPRGPCAGTKYYLSGTLGVRCLSPKYLVPQTMLSRASIALPAQHAHKTSVLPDVSETSLFASSCTATLMLSCAVGCRCSGQAFATLTVLWLGLLYCTAQLMLKTL